MGRRSPSVPDVVERALESDWQGGAPQNILFTLGSKVGRVTLLRPEGK